MAKIVELIKSEARNHYSMWFPVVKSRPKGLENLLCKPKSWGKLRDLHANQPNFLSMYIRVLTVFEKLVGSPVFSKILSQTIHSMYTHC